jgi:hypothetical protein
MFLLGSILPSTNNTYEKKNGKRRHSRRLQKMHPSCVGIQTMVRIRTIVSEENHSMTNNNISNHAKLKTREI